MSEQEPGGFNNESQFSKIAESSGIGRIDDATLAEHMAHATDAYETDVVREKKLALDHAAKIGERDNYNHGEAALDHVEAAHDAREAADDRAEFVRAVYEETKDL